MKSLRDVFPESDHVAGAGLGTAADSAVWEFAAEREMIIVSKDEDFHQLAFLKGPPPKVVWVRLGNCTTADVETALRRSHPTIGAFAADTESSFLIIGPAPGP